MTLDGNVLIVAPRAPNFRRWRTWIHQDGICGVMTPDGMVLIGRPHEVHRKATSFDAEGDDFDGLGYVAYSEAGCEKAKFGMEQASDHIIRRESGG